MWGLDYFQEGRDTLDFMLEIRVLRLFSKKKSPVGRRRVGLYAE